MLFVELALIRWLGSNVVYLSYFSNFVLLGSFLGIGVGFLHARRRVELLPWAPVALGALVVFILVTDIEVRREAAGVLYFGKFEVTGAPPWLALSGIFVAVALVMATIADGVARTFARFEPLEAYRLDIMGSILGIVAFSCLSFLGAPPLAWGVVTVICFGALLGKRLVRPFALVAIIALLIGLGRESFETSTSWSAYYKVHLRDFDDPEHVADIDVNGIPHQSMESAARRRDIQPFYFYPYERSRDLSLDDVLIVGAGSGSDVAIALSKGAKHVDAVEIDRRLQQIGAELHPDRPYENPAVDVHIDDGRAFLEKSDQEYDLILFALPDSLTLVSGQSNLRLESFLFTREAMASAREHLKPNGTFAMYNYYRQPWLIDRLAGTLAQVYGHPPCVDKVGEGLGLATLTQSLAQDGLSCPTRWVPAGEVPPPVSDDYPFLYLENKTIPTLYLTVLGLILLASLVIVRILGGPFKSMSSYLDLFFMGAAFLLIETKNVVQFALLFGTTWFVNALAFLGILLSVYVAIEVAKRKRFDRPRLLYGLLFAMLVVAWLVPQASLLELELPFRFVAAIALAFGPIFVANLVFAERFQDVGDSTTAFGANLLGAMVGGALEYSALIIGYRGLLIVAALLYAGAFMVGFGRRGITAPT
jgi:ABC-type multidrug transport system permease subunit